ncbi:hypothetical protein A3F45_04325 [Candidatus Curtissbacteria bacterium RIFCSPHIGHO2_12_FULL_41_17]|uniref:OmpR/PhoB-type domain-containing protein n=2 Tax=Candidatus Curtissiibacteriota TaxID=1752717 RepID=A0A1F5HGL3_9BACT|nr:MAG: hypothetical protein A2693_00220 [Candidatus Curtissbacteria bacterium RIFCSPHIGHO2_01_FULL_40_12]OGE03232.1 MAG: hypothetical protein A3F45_04325 [Candidatus Curtissbacteria bacterium RIFCSPHIGHO2_12_FULL_41_17]
MLIFESTFPNDYRRGEVKQILDYVLTGKFCQIVCIPGAGKATILRLLSHNRNLLKFHLKEKEEAVRFLYLNLEHTNYQEEQIAKFLLVALDEKAPNTGDYFVLTKKLTEAVNKLVVQGQTIIFLFDHFDEYQNRIPRSFFQLLRSLKSIAKYKFAVAFATRRDLTELVDGEILKDFYDFFTGNIVYLAIHDEAATNLLFSQIERVFDKKIPQKDKEKIIDISGGHIKLTKVLAESHLRENISLDMDTLLKTQIVQATLSEIWLALTAPEQQALRSVAQNKEPMKDTLENLIKFDLLKKLEQSNLPRRQAGNLTIQQYIFTIPLLKEFVISTVPTLISEKFTFNEKTKEIMRGQNLITDLLSPQEYRLLQFLIENQGRLITRDEIIKAVWPQALVAEGITDEAIDQLIYRLRKKTEDDPNNPKHTITVKGQGFRFNP